MSQLRTRMQEEMKLRNYRPKTIQAYVAAVRQLAEHYRKGRSARAGRSCSSG